MDSNIDDSRLVQEPTSPAAPSPPAQEFQTSAPAPGSSHWTPPGLAWPVRFDFFGPVLFQDQPPTRSQKHSTVTTTCFCRIKEVVSVSDLPFIADADTGFGEVGLHALVPG